MASHNHQALRRLMVDQEEIIKSPVANVSAVPLDSDMFEWHCNIRQDSYIYHVVLYFPQNYPYSSPSAEFMPRGFNYNRGAIKRGKKGDQICLSIFSDFAKIHSEWANEKGTGWSPGYTAQTVLLNVVSFLSEANNSNGSSAIDYQKLCRKFDCRDCGHTFDQPYPPFRSTKKTTKPSKDAEKDCANKTQEGISLNIIVDYISKETFQPLKMPVDNELFGYGLVVTPKGKNKYGITTPCEFLSAATFYGMKQSRGVVHSVMKETLSHFIPLYINKIHGSQIKTEFEKVLTEVQSFLFTKPYSGSYANIVMKLIPNLMCSTVVDFSKGFQHTSDNSLQGYFALHHLFLWALAIYPELETEIDKRLSLFVSNPLKRTKDACADIGQWLMLLSVSQKFTWKSVAGAYLLECYRRNVMWYLKTDRKLASPDTAMAYRLQRTFELTTVSRDLLSFQVAFLEIAKPEDMNREQIVARYESNLGFPSPEMVSAMKTACEKIKSEITNYGQWYKALGLPVPSKESMHEILTNSVKYANSTKGYYFSN